MLLGFGTLPNAKPSTLSKTLSRVNLSWLCGNLIDQHDLRSTHPATQQVAFFYRSCWITCGILSLIALNPWLMRNATMRYMTRKCSLSSEHSKIGVITLKAFLSPSILFRTIVTFNTGALHKTSHVVKRAGLCISAVLIFALSINQDPLIPKQTPSLAFLLPSQMLMTITIRSSLAPTTSWQV